MCMICWCKEAVLEAEGKQTMLALGLSLQRTSNSFSLQPVVGWSSINICPGFGLTILDGGVHVHKPSQHTFALDLWMPPMSLAHPHLRGMRGTRGVRLEMSKLFCLPPSSSTGQHLPSHPEIARAVEERGREHHLGVAASSQPPESACPAPAQMQLQGVGQTESPRRSEGSRNDAPGSGDFSNGI